MDPLEVSAALRAGALLDASRVVSAADLALATGAVKSAVATCGKMLREARAQLEIVPANKHRDALANLVTMLETMIAQFAS